MTLEKYTCLSYAAIVLSCLNAVYVIMQGHVQESAYWRALVLGAGSRDVRTHALLLGPHPAAQLSQGERCRLRRADRQVSDSSLLTAV